MTDQIPEYLINDHSRVRFGALHLYYVIRGDIRANRGFGDPYEFVAQPRENPPPSTALWRGHIANFRLLATGELELVGYQYDDQPGYPLPRRDQVHEILQGDFWLVMSDGFVRPRTYVPFRNGRIVEDRAAWITETWDE